MQAAWMIAGCEECAGRAYNMIKVEEKRGGLAARAVVFSKPSCGKRAKPYERAGASKRLAPCKLHAKSLAICENGDVESDERVYCLSKAEASRERRI